MKTIADLKEKVESDMKDPIESTFIAMCRGVHPLMVFVPDFYNEEIKHLVVPLTREKVIAEMQDYIDFAFMKARDQRGISAERSIWKFRKWLWLLEDDEITNFGYNDYGIALLTRIAEKYGLVLKAEE